MALSPIGRLIEIKPRPQTTLQLLVAIEEPVSTVVVYVFTPSIKEHFGILLQNVPEGLRRRILGTLRVWRRQDPFRSDTYVATLGY